MKVWLNQVFVHKPAMWTRKSTQKIYAENCARWCDRCDPHLAGCSSSILVNGCREHRGIWHIWIEHEAKRRYRKIMKDICSTGICLISKIQVQHDQVDKVSQLYPGNVKPPNLLRNLKASRQLPCEQQHVDSIQGNVRSSCRLVSCMEEVWWHFPMPSLSGNSLLLGYRVL